jgi:hypothetical protein
MKLSTLGTGTAGAVALALGALVMAPSASAVGPTTATVQIQCRDWGTGQAKLEAQQDGSTAAITFSTPVVFATHYIPANTIDTTITLSNARGEDVTFKGKANPLWNLLGQAFDSGPVTGTVAPGDVLEFKSVTSTISTLTISCTAISPQTPGPFVF